MDVLKNIVTLNQEKYSYFIVESDTLSKADLCDSTTSRQIAKAVFKLHSFTSPSFTCCSIRPILWNVLRKWHAIVVKEADMDFAFSNKLDQNQIDLALILNRIDALEKELNNVGTIVFCHNDVSNFKS